MIEFVNIKTVDEWLIGKMNLPERHLRKEKDLNDVETFLRESEKLSPEFNFRLKWLKGYKHDWEEPEKLKGYLYFKEGAAPFNWFLLTPDLFYSRVAYDLPDESDREKIWKSIHTPLLWDKWKIKEDILEIFKETEWNKKYPGSTEDLPDLNFDYVFWPGQDPIQYEDLSNKRTYGLDMFEWAIENKIHLVYKFHPAEVRPDRARLKRIKHIVNNYGKSPYVHLLKKGDVNKLVRNSIAVMSDHSHVVFQAMLYNKPVVHRRKFNTMGLIIPNGDTPEKMWNAKEIIGEEDMMRFFSFFYDLHIDVQSQDFPKKLRTRFQRYQDKVPIEEFFLPE